MPGDVTIVSLSRPNCFAATPRIVPSTTPGFYSTGTDGMQAQTISSVRSKKLFTSSFRSKPDGSAPCPSLIRPSPIGDLRPVRALFVRVAQVLDNGVLHLLF